jgi:hypothetical protein
MVAQWSCVSMQAASAQGTATTHGQNGVLTYDPYLSLKQMMAIVRSLLLGALTAFVWEGKTAWNALVLLFCIAQGV